MLFNYANVLLLFVLGGVFVAANLLLSRLLRPSNPYPEKLSSYECGEEPTGEAWVRFNPRFYIIALAFLIFEVELVFMIPWAVVFKELGWFAFWEMMIFIVILLFGLAYIWVKGDLEWIREKVS